MDSAVSSTMRYYESIYERYLKNLPPDKGDATKLTHKEHSRKVGFRYVWTDEDLAKMREMRLRGVPFRVMAKEFGVDWTIIQRAANKHKMYSPNEPRKRAVINHG